jgi:enoyl-CoA hydratase
METMYYYEDFKTLRCEHANEIMVIAVSREEALNALNAQVYQELAEAFLAMAADDKIGAVILTGAGNRAFIAGADISEMVNYSLLEARRFSLLANKSQKAITQFPKPTIAAINGYAFGGGLELAMCCDLRIASERAKLGQPEINLGIIPGAGATQRLSRIVGVGRAKEMLFTGKPISAERAYEIGLVNRVVPHEQLMDEACKMAGMICQKPRTALALMKSAVDVGQDMDLDKALKIEVELFAECFCTRDAKEGLAAFLEKREPAFEHR